jgi:hypothetical protein
LKRIVISALLVFSAILLLVAMRPMPERDRLVELYANIGPGGGGPVGFEMLTSEEPSTPFSLPPGWRLLVTDVMVNPNIGDGLYEAIVVGDGSDIELIRIRLDTSVDSMLNLPFSSGIVFRSAPRVFAYQTSSDFFTVRLLGRLEKD